MSKAVVIMAAGLGTRMKSDLIKVLHPVAGRPLIHYPVRDALALGAEKVVVIVGHQRERVEAYLKLAFPEAPVVTAFQAEQLGTAHAVLCAREALEGFEGDVFILSGDVPTFDLEQIQALDEAAGEALVGLVTMKLDEPAMYGRIIRDEQEKVTAITEARDCEPDQLQINEVNAGIYRARADFLFGTLSTLGNDNAQGEFYLTDLIQKAADAGHGVEALVLEGEAATSAEGVNDRVDLSRAEARMQHKLRVALMKQGVTLVDPGAVWVHDGVQVGSDTVIEPGVCLFGATRIGDHCAVGQNSRLENAEVPSGTVIAPGTQLSN